MSITRTFIFAAFAAVSLAAIAETPETPETPAAAPVSATVRVGDAERFFCTGVLISPSLVLTAGHCVGGAPIGGDEYPISIGVTDGKTYNGFVALASHPDGGFLDVALIRLHDEVPGLVEAKLRCDPTPLPVGTEIRAEGYPGGLEGSKLVAWGRISAVPYRLAVATPWATSIYVAQMPIGKGDSGGPVFDPEGRVFALMVGHNSAQPGWAVLVPIAPLCKILELAA